MWIFPPRLGKLSNKKALKNGGGAGVIPVILLGDSGDNQLCAALQGLLRHRCGWHVDGEFFWQADADVLLLDLPFPAHLDAGGGLVVLKESFESADAPAHLLHASCIVPFGHPAAEEFVRACGLPSVYCGGSGGDLTLSSAQEQTVLTLQRQLRRLDGTEVAAGDFVTALPEQLSPCEQLCCAAVLLMLGEKLPEG